MKKEPKYTALDIIFILSILAASVIVIKLILTY